MDWIGQDVNQLSAFQDIGAVQRLSLFLLVEVIETLLTLYRESRDHSTSKKNGHCTTSPQITTYSLWKNLWKTASLATLARPAHDARAIRAHEASAKRERGTYPHPVENEGGMGG